MHVTSLFSWISAHAPTAQPQGEHTGDPAGLAAALRARVAHLGESDDEHYLEEAQDLADLEHRQRHLEHDGTPMSDQPPV